MKKYLNRFSILAFLLPLSMWMSSCTDDEDQVITDPQTQARLSATATESSTTSENNSRIIVSGFSVSQFTAGTQNVEMKFYSKTDLLAGISLGNLKLKSNLNAELQTSSSSKKSSVLISSGESRFSVIGEGNTPEGNYTEATFKLYKNTEVSANDPMYRKSLLITGEVNGKLTQFWTESEKTIRAVSESSAGVQVENNTELVLVFEMDKLFGGIDLRTAVDANDDGRIEIGPNSPDGNTDIFTKIESNIESAVTLKKR